MLRTVVTSSEAETIAFGRELASSLAPGSLIALTGDLGTGKTALVRGICEALGCVEQVTSPTFTIINEYDGTLPVLHCDLYRLEVLQDMLDIGLDDIFRTDAVLLVEWAERAVALLPLPRLEIRCGYGDTEFERVYEVNPCHDDATSILTGATRA